MPSASLRAHPPIRVGLLGLGTVGVGVVRLWRQNRAIIERRIGTGLEITHAAVRSRRKRRGVSLQGIRVTTAPAALWRDPSIHIVVELIGGEHPALEYVLDAMRHGKHVVTANKVILAKHWALLMNTAQRHGVDIYFEASVAGGIPLIQALHDGLAANNIHTIYGILNGTTNFILTRMLETRMSYEAALRAAQSKGYAESDPSSDVKGIDSANKLAVLVAIAFNCPIRPEDMYVEGITRVTHEAIVEAKDYLHHVVKLLAIARRVGNRLDVRVHPTLIPDTHLLSAVRENYNGVYITGDAVGPVMFYGQGAGQLPTASAVLSDIVYVARNIHQGVAGRVPSVQYSQQPSPLTLMPMDEIKTRYYLRLQALDRPGVFSSIASILARQHISLASVLQLEHNAGHPVPVVLTTHEAQEGRMRRALAAIRRLTSVRGDPLLLRMEHAQ